MHNRKLAAIVFACLLLSLRTLADTLTFIAQPVSGSGIDYSWFSAGNWFVSDGAGNLVPAGRVPLDTETAIVTGTVDLGAGGVRVQTLVATNNAAVTNGTMSVENLRLLSGSTLDSTAVSVLAALIVGGTNCIFRNTTLAIVGVGSGILQPVPPATTATLVLTQGTSFQFGGVLSLTDGAQIIGGGLPQSKLVVEPTAVLLSTNFTAIRGAPNAHLLIDQNGLTRVDGGTLTFGDGIDWQCSVGSQEFRAVAPSSLIVFSNVFHTEASVIALFTGSGTNRWLKGASIDGTAQVSVADPATQSAGPGNLEILDSVNGAGTVHILGTTSQGGVAVWDNGKLSCPGLTVDAGASLVLSGSTGGFRELAGCGVTNQGSCSFLGGGLDFSQGAVFNNQAGALFNVQGDGHLTSADTSGIFLNAGTFQKLSSGTTYFGDTNSSAGPAFNNTGLCDIQGGQLRLLGGAGSGEFRQASGTVLWFSGGSYVVNAGCSFTGNGKVLVAQRAAPARLVLNDSISFAELELGINSVLEAANGALAKPVPIASLLAHDNAEITNGTFQIESLQMLDQSRIDLSTFDITGLLSIGGTVTIAGTFVNVASNALATLQTPQPGAGVTLILTNGTIFQDSGQVGLADGALISGGGVPQSKLVIQPGGILASTNAATIQGATNAPMVLDNSGSIQIAAGTLTFTDGLKFQSSSGQGEFRAAAPTALMLFAGAFNVSSATSSFFTGPGTNVWLGNTVIDGTAQVGNAVPGSATGGAGNLWINGPVSGLGFLHIQGGSVPAGMAVWNNGALSLAHVDIDTGASLLISGGPANTRQLSGCALNNSGSCFFVGGDLALSQGASLNNLAAGDLELQTNVALTTAGSGIAVSLNNAGTFVQSATGISKVAVDFNNSGFFEIKAGVVEFLGSWIQTKGTTMLDSGAALNGTNVTVLGGTVTGTGVISAKLTNNAGEVSPGPATGILSIPGANDYQQGAAASLLIGIGGTEPGSRYDQLAVGGTAALDGQLLVEFLNGFVPQPGASFQVLTCASSTGRFAQISAPSLSGALWVPRYNVTNVTLVLAQSVTLSRPTFSGGSVLLPVNTTPGVQYLVQATPTLNPPTWQTIATFTGDGSVKTASDQPGSAQRFYRVLLE